MTPRYPDLFTGFRFAYAKRDEIVNILKAAHAVYPECIWAAAQYSYNYAMGNREWVFYPLGQTHEETLLLANGRGSLPEDNRGNRPDVIMFLLPDGMLINIEDHEEIRKTGVESYWQQHLNVRLQLLVKLLTCTGITES